jgi:spermidine/putrescine transport system permease protein
MSQAAEVAKEIDRRDIRNRWLLSGPALLTILLAGAAPLLIVLMYSLMVKGDYGDVKYWQFSTDGWVSVLFERSYR